MNVDELTFENVGRWPALYRGIFIALVCVMFAGAFYYYVTIPQLDQLKVLEAKEKKLKDSFKIKAALSANLDAYRAQISANSVIFEALINKLPSKKEIASLLDDISFIGGDNGLQFKSINWGDKKEGEFSIEVPIRIQVVGRYEQLGGFVAQIAALPRIVILDDLRLTKGKKGQLTLNVIAKAYRYKGRQK